MKSMKGLSMNKVLGSIKKKTGTGGGGADAATAAAAAVAAARPGETPEVTAHNSVKAFCESGGNNSGDDVLFLPPIVDAAESSPAAAAECARIIRKYISKDYASRPSWQYNAIMLVRILTDNPGDTFTRNFDQKFVDTAKALLKGSRDNRVRQILMETLDDFEHTKMDDENLKGLVEMWKKEKEKALKDYHGKVPPPPQARTLNAPPFNPHSQNYFSRSHNSKRLPDAIELASRLEEARTSAKLLEQVVMNTPPAEMLNNDLIKEFADRCLSASRSIQGYMVSENPGPDNDTMESLIDTNEQLQTALNQHQRAVLNARKQLGERTDDDSPAPPVTTNGQDRIRQWQQGLSAAEDEGPPVPERKPGNGKGKETEVYDAPSGPPPNFPTSSGAAGRAPRDHTPSPDPFADPQGESSRNPSEPRLAYEPFNPGFNAASAAVGEKKDSKAATNVSDDDDLYDAPGKSKEPVYRY